MTQSLKEQNAQIVEVACPDGLARRKIPLIALAFDPLFYPDETHELMRNLNRSIEGIPWLHALYGIRRYYEESDGNAYTNALGHAVFDQIEFILNSGMQNALKLQNHERIQAECWIVRAGPGSKLTRGIRFLCDQLYSGFENEDLDSALSALEDQPFADPGQLAAANLYRDWFKDSIQFLLSGEGSGWLKGLENHPIRERNRAPRWGITTNGRNVAIGMEVRTRSQTVSLSQDGSKIERSTWNGSVIITRHELLDAGFKQGQIDTSVGKTEFPDLDSICFACESKNGVFSPFIDMKETNEVPARQAKSLLAVIPVSAASNFRLGAHEVPCVTKAITKTDGYRVARLDFSNIDRTKPLPLYLNGGDPLIRIGAAPWLLPASGEQDFWIHNDRDAWVVFGSETEILVGGISESQEEVEWRNVGQSDDGRAVLKCGENEWGFKKIASMKVTGRSYPVSVGVVFLPAELKKAILSGVEWNHSGVRWIPELNSQVIRQTAESIGLCSGIIHARGVSTAILHPSRSHRFWNYLGVKPLGECDQLASFSSLNECRNFRTGFYVPHGQHQVEWDGRSVFEVEGHGFFQLWFDELGLTGPATSDHDRFFQIRLHDGTQVPIMRCDAGPRIKLSDDGHVLVLPKSANVETWSYAILVEGIQGVRMLAEGSCTRLAPLESDTPQIRSLGDHHIPADLGAAIMLWSDSSNFEGLLDAAHRPSGVHCPIVIQKGNPFLSSEGLSMVDDQVRQQDFSLPSWAGIIFERRVKHESWEESSALLRGLEEVQGGKHPPETWVPTAAFHLCLPDGSTAPIQTLEGSRVRTKSGEYRLKFDRLVPMTVWCPKTMETFPFEWVLSPDDCDWLAPPDPQIPEIWQNGVKAVSEIFYQCIDTAEPVIGSIKDGRLAWLFDYLNNWLCSEDFEPGRQILFQIAVIDRLTPLLHATGFPNGRVQDIVNGVKVQTDACSNLWKSMESDLITVEWLLYWFRERDITSIDEANQMDEGFPTEEHLHQLFGWLVGNNIPWFADPEFSFRSPQGSHAFVEMLVEALDLRPPVEGELEPTRTWLSAMGAVARGERPESIWLPNLWFKNAGVSAGWIFNQKPDFPRLDFKVGAECDNVPCLIDTEAIKESFGKSLVSSRNFLGDKNDQGHLAFVYFCLSSWLEISTPKDSVRPAIFHLAVLCRLRALRVLPFDPELDRCIRNSCLAVWKESSLRKILIGDLLTIEWTVIYLGQSALHSRSATAKKS